VCKGPQGPAGPGGSLGAAEFFSAQFNYNSGDAFVFGPFNDFGSGINYSGNTFSSIILQPGFYNIHLGFPLVETNARQVQMFINGALPPDAQSGLLNSAFDFATGIAYFSEDRQVHTASGAD
jgi:hypothetical protein